MMGEAKARESFKITQLTRRSNERLKRLKWRVRQSTETARELNKECNALQRDLVVVLDMMREFVTYAGVCIPKGKAPRKSDELNKRLDNLKSITAEKVSSESLAVFRKERVDHH